MTVMQLVDQMVYWMAKRLDLLSAYSSAETMETLTESLTEHMSAARTVGRKG